MANVEACTKIRKLLSSQFKRAFGEDLEAHLNRRKQTLWLIGIDSTNKTFVDVCGDIDQLDMTAINSKGFLDTDAGYRADAQDALDLSNKSVDIFLLNIAHYNANPEFLEPIIVHELAHLLEQTHQAAQPQFNDEEKCAGYTQIASP